MRQRYVCVHCGEPALELFKQYSESVLKLMQCTSCQNPVDKYIEYDGVIILIDIILFNKEAYRHVLFNTEFENHWKLALLLLVIMSYDEWLFLKKMLTEENFECQTEISPETLFYLSFLVTTIGKALFFLCIVICCTLFEKFKSKKILWKGIIASSFGYFLILPSLIWQDTNRDLHLVFIGAYNLISHIQALTVVSRIARPFLAIILILAASTDFMLCKYLRTEALNSMILKKF